MTSTFEFVTSFDGTKLRLKRDIQDDPRAIFVISHGAGASIDGDQYRLIEQGIVDAGYSVYFFDHRGHGKSEGLRGYYNDFSELVGDIKFIVDLAKQENPGKKVFLFGNSMGGVGSEIFGIQYPGYVDGIILSVSAVCGKDKVPVKPDDMTTEFPLPLPESMMTPEVLADPPRRTNALGYMMDCAFYYLHDHFKAFSEPVLILCAEDDMHFDPRDLMNFFLECGSEDKMFRAYGHAPHKLFGSFAGPEAMRNMLAWLDLRT